jgi:hypothetical protein
MQCNLHAGFSTESAILLRDAGEIHLLVIIPERKSEIVILAILHRTTPLFIIGSLGGAACHLRMSPPPSSKSGLSPNRVFGLFFARSPVPKVVSACSRWVNSFRIQGFPQMPAEKVSGRACADREHDAPKRPITAVSSRTHWSVQGCRTGVGRIGRRLADGHQQAGSKQGH